MVLVSAAEATVQAYQQYRLPSGSGLVASFLLSWLGLRFLKAMQEVLESKLPGRARPTEPVRLLSCGRTKLRVACEKKKGGGVLCKFLAILQRGGGGRQNYT